ncbi:MAG: xanthine dehydrogenase molybdopterin binding subunit [Betaproteobacteria bacterium]|nr:xanthine dehydrogenase molybdopterin binding subunit [Betaproteobacteria bacterium]
MNTRLSTPRFHDSATAQVQGRADFIDDLPRLQGLLHAAPILSPVANGRLLALDARDALAQPGIVGIVRAPDIPGSPLLATHVHDEPIFADPILAHVGQVLGLVVGTSHQAARQAARQHVRLQTEAQAPLLHARQALRAGSFVLPTVQLRRGDADQALQNAPHCLSGSLEIGGQEHFYMETQIARAEPQEGGQWLIHSSTQHPGEVQHWVAQALGIALHQVRVVCRRLGGGFGGKETQSGHLAVWAALAARKFHGPVQMRLERSDDFLITGKRHPFSHDWRVGFDDSGSVLALDSVQLAHCGHSADLSGPVADRAIFHTDNAYFLSAVHITSHRCKTHTQSHTAFRGFGGPQGVLLIETLMGDIARHLGRDALDVRLNNLYGVGKRDTTPYGMQVEDNILQPLMQRLEKDCDYRARRHAVTEWNATHEVLKKGLALTPVKFGISFTATQFNQAGAVVAVYTDGSVRVNHGGTEMGQGLHTKVCAIVAQVLGVPASAVLPSASDTAQVPNASATAASSGTDLNGRAAERAALQVRENMARCLAQADGCDAQAVRFADGQVLTPARQRSFTEAVQYAYSQRVPLWSDGFYATPKIHYDLPSRTGRPFYYFACGAACSEVAIDTLTGEYRLLRTDILHDVGHSLHTAIDIGQIEGGFAQGLGWLTTEELVWNAQGELLTRGASTYKIPTAADMPAQLHIALWPEANREDNVGASKAVGEPPFMLAISVYEALRDAIGACRPGRTPIRLDTPATPERVLHAIMAD